jgi:hypothetical protein
VNELFRIERPHQKDEGGVFGLTDHAVARMRERYIPDEAVLLVLTYGRVVYTGDGARIFALGKREVKKYAQKSGHDLLLYQGVQVVVGIDNTILTVYRNSNFKALRRKTRKRGRRDDPWAE